MQKRITFYAIASAIVSMSATGADNYQTFLNASYSATNSEFEQQDTLLKNNTDTWSLNAAYYFTPRPTMGPNKEFQYINQQSFVSGSVLSSDDADSQAVRGEYLFSDWVVSGSASFNDNNDQVTVGLGYFITQDFKLSVYNTSFDSTSDLFDGDNSLFTFTAEYVVPLKDNDYLGFAFNTDEDTAVSTLNTKYFTQVGTEQYISVSATATIYGDDIDYNDDAISAAAEFYFTKRTSFNVGVILSGDADGYSVGATHFFNDNSSVNIGYADYDMSSSIAAVDSSQNAKQWNIGYQYQY
ncbi:putative porin [Alteromonas gilva]|uniref:Porin n=1 Tax=Alteromonas gilva TaxID=2987522 RepID=A0ABT5L976_9ALTE|nr:putative porin [Alteromonas gilva]MDC8832538.1 putative porin [Alteromonas gilva]